MPTPSCTRAAKTGLALDGTIADYIINITNQWLLVAPNANSAMLEMFRDRDAQPFRQMVEWAGEFSGKYLTAAVQVLRVTGDKRLRIWIVEGPAAKDNEVRHCANQSTRSPTVPKDSTVDSLTTGDSSN